MKPFVKSAAILMVALVLVAGCDKLKGMKKADAPAADATAMPQEGQPVSAPVEGAAPAAADTTAAPAAAH